jgi:UDP-glucose:(heptosyl)LPS alpha-1,3-glucosyltransferase
VKEAYWAADAFALPTYYDPCSLVVLEALTCGLPVITTAMNGAGELITPGREGFVVPSPDSIEAISEALERLVDDGQRAIMARHARALGQAQSLDLHVERVLRVFEEVAADKRPLLRKRARTRMDVPR